MSNNKPIVNGKQPFEDYPRLSELLLHAAHNWKTDSLWSETLEEINKVCSQLTIAKKSNWQPLPSHPEK